MPAGDPVPRTVRLPDPLTLPAGAVVAGTRLGRGEAVRYILGPEGSCDVYLGADGAGRLGLGPADGNSGIWEVFAPGGAALWAAYGCPYIPEVALLVPGEDCSKPRGTEVRTVPTGVPNLYASLVWAQHADAGPLHGELWGHGNAGTARYGTVVLFMSHVTTYLGHRNSTGLSISCSLPDSEDDICTASLGLFLTQMDGASTMRARDRNRLVQVVRTFVEQHRSEDRSRAEARSLRFARVPLAAGLPCLPGVVRP
ncbi:hypothetical protein [Streptomyces achromogenes]|uniref:hypothetical protein n=1 Tax=Streptomyces achromogenes TaxID=67255 RepID=UPI0036FD26DB